MKTLKDCITLIQNHSSELRQEFGIKSLRIFGSVARGEQREDSDVDICVEMEPKMFLLIRLKRFLEHILGSSVDVVRLHKNINAYLKSEIDCEGVYVIRYH